MLGWLNLVKLDLLRICYLLDFRPFQVVFEGAHQFWASILRGWAGGRYGGWGGRWQQLGKSYPEKLHSEDADTGAVHSWS